MNRENRVLNPNPYGPIKAQDIERLETSLPDRLPQDYREYLLENNGGDFEKSCATSNTDADVVHSISELFSLYRGPEHTRLENQWDLSEYFDLQEIKHLTKEYLAFGVTGTGDVFLVRLGKGDVLIYLHDYVDHAPIEGPGGAIFPLAGSFSEFVSNAISQEESLKKAEEIEPGFTARMKRLKKESGFWD